MAPALLCGNTVVIKPASQVPSLTLELARALQEAGLPKGVLNVVVGNGREVGGELATNAAVAALSFTGSYQIGRQIYLQLAERMARAQMEMGGKNPTIVLADADLDLAATLVTRAGFGLTGQACTATSRAIVERSVLEPFLEKLIAKARALKVGNGLGAGVVVGLGRIGDRGTAGCTVQQRARGRWLNNNRCDCLSVARDAAKVEGYDLS